MEISIFLNEEELAIVEKFAQREGMDVSLAVRMLLMERIEGEREFVAFEESMWAFRRNPFSFSLDEVKDELGLS